MTLLQSIQQDLQEDLSGKVQKLPSDILKYYDLASGLMIDGVGSDYINGIWLLLWDVSIMAIWGVIC